HASVLNGRALRRLRIADRDGLVAGRESSIGRLVGRLPPAVLANGFEQTARELAAVGLTTVADATPATAASLAPLRRAAEAAPLRRAMEAGRFPLRGRSMRALGSRAWAARGRLQPSAVKLMVEEGPDGMTPGSAELGRRIGRAAASGAQVAVHCVGAATLVAAL